MNQPLDLTSLEIDAVQRMLQRFWDGAVRLRGQELFERGHVKDVQREAGGSFGSSTRFSAQVLGSRGQPYRTSLDVSIKNGTVIGLCSCPYRVNCKHSVALGYALVSSRKSGAGKIFSSPSDWLQEVSRRLASPRGAPPPQSWQPYYLIDFEQSVAVLSLARRYCKQSGEWGSLKSMSPFEFELEEGLRLMDRELLAALNSATATHAHRGSVPLEFSYWLKGGIGRLMMEWAVRSGRALNMRDLSPMSWGDERATTFDWRRTKGGQRLEAELDPAPETHWRLWTSVWPPLYQAGSEIGPALTELDAEQWELIEAMPPVPKRRMEEVTGRMQRYYRKALADDDVLPRIPELSESVPCLRLIGLEAPGAGVLPVAQFCLNYGELSLCPRAEEVFACQDDIDPGTVHPTSQGQVMVIRDFKRECAEMQKLAPIGLKPDDYQGETSEVWIPKGAESPAQHVKAWNSMRAELEALANDSGWAFEIDSSYRVDAGSVSVEGEARDAGQGWFDLKLNFSMNGLALDTETLLTEWLEAGTPDSMALRNEDDHWAVLDMQPLRPVLGLLEELYGEERVRLPGFKAVQLDVLSDINLKQAPQLKKLRKELKNFKGIREVAPAKHLRADLRDYQQLGLNWLMFLHRYGFGGVLADDMGLGKTLQTLAFLQRLKAGRKLTQGALIVAPTSLIWNWQREAQRFTPNLRTAVMHGLERKQLFDCLHEYDLVITTYALVHRDFEVYRESDFDVTVLDEAQNIKNQHAKTTRKVKQLPSGMRLCLTGTPLENHLGELWSLVDYVLPGLLGNDQLFRRHFRQSIEQDGDAERSKELSCRVAPFMLRRTKSEVVKELPSKTEIQQTVHLVGKQQALYESVRVSMEKRVRDLIKAKGLANSRIEFLDALLKLRQACIDPRLVRLKKATGIKNSAKMEWLKENMPEMVEEGRKILLFSQFTKMLDLVETELQALGLKTVKLTGRTRKRDKVISAFQDGEVPVFLISLKAGGSGLNLTAADTVIHVDPWWNPAVENQATDRAYRIGQNKPVFVYKLVAAGTVEEKIQAMQRNKQALADNLFNQSREAGLPDDGDTLLNLFSESTSN